MARTAAEAVFDSSGDSSWSLSFISGSSLRLRKGGYFAGYPTVRELQQACYRFSESMAESTQENSEVYVSLLEDYYLLNAENSLVPLSELAFDFAKTTKQYYAVGNADGTEVMREVNAWGVSFSKAPQISLRTSQGKWFQLGRPRKIYAAKVSRSLFVTLNVLNFLYDNPSARLSAALEHVERVCGFDFEPREKDLIENSGLLMELRSQYPKLQRAEVIQAILDDEYVHDSKRQRTDVQSEDDETDGEGHGGEAQPGDDACALCDDGGGDEGVLCCDGPCLRSFHPTPVDGCQSLNLSKDRIAQETFYCDNCTEKIHQCFQCGKLGRSSEPNQEVFLCATALCGHFYHVSCGGSADYFICPRHACFECGGVDEPGKSLYPCRRCPRAWHRSCLDPRIKFDDEEHGGETRGWHITGETKFVYCMKHKIRPGHIAPASNVLFPPKPPRARQPVTETAPQQPITLIKKPVPAAPLVPKAEVDEPIDVVIRESMVLVTPQMVVEGLREPSTVARKISQQPGKFESLIRASKQAVECLQSGNVVEAQRLLPAEHWNWLNSLKTSLNVYLSPILYGNRYSPFGRKFTQGDKLEEIARRLQFYVEPGDTIADLCCGSNEFSRLMEKKLAEAKIWSFFKNYDIVQPEDTFNFERRDYMTIKKSELPLGHKLIIGLNPPFGTFAQLASKFAVHCASFGPKIIILIAPAETRGLEDKGYELIWKDRDLLRGECFYLPGSIDVEGKSLVIENNSPPVLFFWSRMDFAERHRRIAQMQGHAERVRVSFDDVRDKNMMLLRKLNAAIFPVKYQESYYNDAIAAGEFTKLAYYGDTCVGNVACRIEKKEGGDVKVYIMTLGVLAPYRRLGIGSKLLQSVLDLCQQDPKISEIYLHVQTNNDEALEFYKRYGFEVTDTIKNYYVRIEPPDCYLLSKSFKK